MKNKLLYCLLSCTVATYTTENAQSQTPTIHDHIAALANAQQAQKDIERQLQRLAEEIAIKQKELEDAQKRLNESHAAHIQKEIELLQDLAQELTAIYEYLKTKSGWEKLQGSVTWYGMPSRITVVGTANNTQVLFSNDILLPNSTLENPHAQNIARAFQSLFANRSEIIFPEQSTWKRCTKTEREICCSQRITSSENQNLN